MNCAGGVRAMNNQSMHQGSPPIGVNSGFGISAGRGGGLFGSIGDLLGTVAKGVGGGLSNAIDTAISRKGGRACAHCGK